MVAGDHHLYSRRWRVEGGYTLPYGEHANVSARFLYQERLQVWGPPIASAVRDCIDRVPIVETAFQLPLQIRMRTGYMMNRITVVEQGKPPVDSWGTRYEKRMYLTLQVRLGRVLVEGVEGIELDKEAYDVAFVHDKGFVHILVPF